MPKVKSCSVVEEVSNHYLTCKNCNNTLQNGSIENRREFYLEHGGVLPPRFDKFVIDFMEFTGTDNLDEALRHLHSERVAMVELHERNKVLVKYIDLLWPIISGCRELFERIAVSPAAMFLPPILQLKIQKVSGLITQAQKAQAELKKADS